MSHQIEIAAKDQTMKEFVLTRGVRRVRCLKKMGAKTVIGVLPGGYTMTVKIVELVTITGEAV